MYIKNKNKQSDGSLRNEPLTAEEQAELTPDMVIDILKQGNKDFTEDALTVRNNTKRIRQAALCQYPKAVVLSCMDSRVPVEDVFHRGIGDLFVIRIAGNFINEDILGCMEFACKVSGAKLIVVMGHEHCSAIKSAIDNIDMGNIAAMLSKIQPAIHQTNQTFQGEKTSFNPKYVKTVCIQNVNNAINEIRVNSSILKGMEEEERIKIVGAVYQMETGKVTFLN